MADRVAVGRLIVNDGDKRRVIGPGTRFNPDQYGISAEEVKHYEEQGILREPREDKQEGRKEALRRQSRSQRATRVVSEQTHPAETRHTARTEEQ